jgi:hypothetical protein
MSKPPGLGLGLGNGAGHGPGLRNKPAIDLLQGRAAHWLARDQGSRETCVAYAVAACLELQQAGAGNDFPRLSPQFLYWQMRQLPPPPAPPPGWAEGATKLGQARDALKHHGICREASCPDADIFPSLPRPAAGQLPDQGAIAGPPPDAAAIAEAAGHKVASSVYHDWPPGMPRPVSVAAMVHEQLAQGRPVAVALPQFRAPGASPLAATNWWLPEVAHGGQVRDPDPGWLPVAGHVVCVLGFQPDREEASGGWFIFRNSRGLEWAHAAVDPLRRHPPRIPARGFGAISASHVEAHCWEMFCPILG